MSVYKLTYFGFRARGEVPRQLLHLSGVKFEDNRIEKTQWPEIKPTTPFGQLPVLSVDGKELAQNPAIVRYLAQKFGYAGKDDWEKAQVDALTEQIRDFMTEVRPTIISFNVGDDVAPIVEKVLPARDRLFAILEPRLAANKSGWLVGDGLTYADLVLAELVVTWQGLYGAFTQGHDAISAHRDRVHAYPKLKSWFDSRPQTTY